MHQKNIQLQKLGRGFRKEFIFMALFAALAAFIPDAGAHGVTAGDKGYIQESSGSLAMPFIYLGAKHTVTGYDHLLFLFGVVFFLYRFRDVGVYVSLFAVGHTVTLLLGTLMKISVSAYLIDAIIGFSIVYREPQKPTVYRTVLPSRNRD